MAMKAERLMINDLVRTNRGEVIKVESISTKRQHRKVGFHRADDKYHIKYVRQGQIEPILLTKDFSVANGWKKNGVYHNDYILKNEYYYFIGYNFDNHHLRIRIYSEDAVRELFVSVRYVHELQQALRMCGLDDIANNIIIEENGSSKIYV